MSKWFPDKYNSGVVGRFIEIEVIDPIASTAQNKEVTKIVPALESKIPGSPDTNVQRLKDFNKKELMGNYPGAYEYYEQHREEHEPKVPVIRLAKGTPLEDADFISRQRARQLADAGFATVEDLARMSDGVKQMLGREAGKLQKEAAAFLARS